MKKQSKLMKLRVKQDKEIDIIEINKGINQKKMYVLSQKKE